jgi:hypothetical protein
MTPTSVASRMLDTVQTPVSEQPQARENVQILSLPDLPVDRLGTYSSSGADPGFAPRKNVVHLRPPEEPRAEAGPSNAGMASNGTSTTNIDSGMRFTNDSAPPNYTPN